MTETEVTTPNVTRPGEGGVMNTSLWLDLKSAADGAIYEHLGYAAILRVVAERLAPGADKAMLLFQADIAEQGAGR